MKREEVIDMLMERLGCNSVFDTEIIANGKRVDVEEIKGAFCTALALGRSMYIFAEKRVEKSKSADEALIADRMLEGSIHMRAVLNDLMALLFRKEEVIQIIKESEEITVALEITAALFDIALERKKGENDDLN